VANVTSIFGTSPKTKPEEKKWGDMAYYIPPPCKVGGTRPPCPSPSCAHDCMHGHAQTSVHDDKRQKCNTLMVVVEPENERRYLRKNIFPGVTPPERGAATTFVKP